MSKIDEKYINALDNFTDALEQIVETLKEQQKTGKADVVNEMLNNTPINNIHQVVIELKKTTKKGFADIKTDNQIIIKKIDSIKQQKESGMFDKIEDPKNKNKIVDGIKVVVLIAAGVLALGMAFKIIGKVDFLSVVALSTSMFMMAAAFSKIIAIENLSYKNVFIAASIIPLMAIGLAASGYILSGFPTFTLMQGVSILFIAGSLGVASYMLLTALAKIKPSSLVMVPLLPVMLPLIALGIVASSYILKYTQQLTLAQVFSAALVGLALGVATIGIAFALKAMRGVTWKEMLMLPLMIPLIAGGIVAASWIFKLLSPIENPVELLISSAVIGLSMLMFVPAIYLLGKMKTDDLLRGGIAVMALSFVMTISSIILEHFVPVKDPLKLGLSALAMGVSVLFFIPAVWLLGKMSLGQILKGSLAILAVSGAILGAAWIFSVLPDKMKYPPFMWSLGAGLSILIFGVLATGLGILATVSLPFFLAGLAAMLGVSAAIVGVSLILQAGNFNGNYPSIKWALGVGASLLIFSVAAIAASVAGIVSAVGSLFTGDKDPLATIAESMVRVSWLLQNGKWDSGFPTSEWASGVGKALALFAAATIIGVGADIGKKIIGFFGGDKDPLMTLTKSIVAISLEIQKGNYSGNTPSKDWALGVGKSLSLFAAVTILSSGAGLAKSITSFFGLGDKDPLMTLTKSIVAVSKEIQKGVYTGNTPTKKWAGDVSTAITLFAVNTVTSSGSGLFKKFTGLFTGDKDPLVTLVKTMVNVSKILNTVNWSMAKTPTKKYVDSVTYLNSNIIDSVGKFKKINLKDYLNFSISMAAIIPMIHLLSTLKPLPSNVLNGYTNFMTKLDDFPELSEIDARAQSITNLANSFLILANSLNDVNSNLEGFTNLSRGLFLISIIDDTKFDNVLKSVDKYKGTLSVINQIPEEQNNLLSLIKGLYGSTPTLEKETTIVGEDSDNKQQKQFYTDISEIRNLLYEFRDHLDKPSQAGSFHKN